MASIKFHKIPAADSVNHLCRPDSSPLIIYTCLKYLSPFMYWGPDVNHM